MASLKTALASVLLLSAAAYAASDSAGELLNNFYVTYSIFPDPFHWFSFFKMPRNTTGADYQDFKATVRNDLYDTYCKPGDFRLCILFDKKGSVAGIQISAKIEEVDSTKQPLVMERQTFWEQQEIQGVQVWSNIVLFVSPETLVAGGRTLSADTPTSPSGPYFKKKDSDARSAASYVASGLDGDSATKVGFVKQGCMSKMGRHYFYKLTPDTKCEDQEPYFLLMNEKTDKLHGFGITQFGRIRPTARDWFEHPPAFVLDTIAPHAPKCTKEWVSKYGLFSIHVYFNESPKSISC